jgi:hypothetical protein
MPQREIPEGVVNLALHSLKRSISGLGFTL